MTAVASISAAVRRLQELLLDEARALGQLKPVVEGTVLPRLQESEEMLMGLPAHKIRVKGAQDDLEFGRRTRNLLSSIEDKVESYALQLGSATSSSREACCGGGGGENTAFGKLVADLKASVDGLKDCVTSYCAEQNQYPQIRKLGQKSQWLVSRANFSSGRWGDEAFGLEEEVRKLTKVLVSEETDPRVVFIVGMGGIGKTILAKKLFNHPDVRHHFKGFAWVYVGGYWSTRDILVTILDQLSSLPRKKREAMMKSEEVELAPQVFRILQRKSCLVVLDDCSDRELLDILSIAVPFAVRSASASKFILTTRNRNLSRFLDPGAVYSLRMESLNPNKSWDLFSHIWRKLKVVLTRDFTTNSTMNIHKHSRTNHLGKNICLRILAATAEGNLEDLELIIRFIGINSSHLKRASLDIKKFDCYSDERLSFIKRLFSCPVLDTLQIEGRIGKTSEIGTISGRFTEIVLNGSELDQDPMPTLENLPNLRILVLEVEAYLGKKLHCSDTGFPELRSLKLSKLYNLEEWEVDEGALQKLSTLEVSMCRRMKKLPEGLQSIITLRKLKVSMMPQQFLGRLRMKNGRGGEDRHKINSKCSIEFGNDDPWLESTNSASQQNNSFDGRTTESQASSSSRSPNLIGSFACLPETERERDVYLQ